MTPSDPTPPQDSPEASMPRGGGAGNESDSTKRGAQAQTTSGTPGPPTPSAPPAPDLDLFGNAPRGHPDWSHRRGEPRVFALIWTVFLTLLATTTLMRAAIGGRLDITVYREALRVTLAIVSAAIVVAWPLMRLSQARPTEGGLLATFKDLLIVVVPLQAVLWPQAILAHWPPAIVAALDAQLSVWAIIVGGVVALSLGPTPRLTPSDPATTRPLPERGRWLAMVVVILVAALGSTAALLLEAVLGAGAAQHDAAAWWRLLSPQAGLYELSADRAAYGQAARLLPAHFSTLVALAGVGVLMWLVAWGREIAAGSPGRGVVPAARAR